MYHVHSHLRTRKINNPYETNYKKKCVQTDFKCIRALITKYLYDFDNDNENQIST